MLLHRWRETKYGRVDICVHIDIMSRNSVSKIDIPINKGLSYTSIIIIYIYGTTYIYEVFIVCVNVFTNS